MLRLALPRARAATATWSAIAGRAAVSTRLAAAAAARRHFAVAARAGALARSGAARATALASRAAVAAAGQRQQQRRGLFGMAELRQPSDFDRLTADTKVECKQLIASLKGAPPSLAVVQKLDELSDRVCRIADLAELCRNVHDHSDWTAAAENALYDLHSFIGALNTDPTIYAAIAAVNADAKLLATFTPEQRRAADLLQQDMVHNGILLDDAKKQRLSELQDDINRLQTEFIKNAQNTNATVAVPARPLLASLPQSSARARVRVDSNTDPAVAHVPLDPDTVQTVLKWCDDGAVRQAVYVASQSLPHDAVQANLQLLQQLIDARHELATLLGFKSYAHYSVSVKMAQTPERAQELLDALWRKAEPIARRELALLEAEKARTEPARDGTARVRIEQWDLSYYMGLLKATRFDLNAHTIATYFPHANVLRGLALVTKQLFNCSLRVARVPAALAWTGPGAGTAAAAAAAGAGAAVDVEVDTSGTDMGFGDYETFDAHEPRVHRITLWDDARHAPVGTLYLDLFRRPTKNDITATFTVRGARKLPPAQATAAHVAAGAATADGYQPPIVALVCNFPPPATGSRGGAVLTHAQVEILFHEFGHALHVLFSRAEFQHLSGARGELEFAETPSTLMENWAWDHRILKLFARSASGEVMPASMLENMRSARHYFGAMDLWTQIVHTQLDLTLFGPPPPRDSPDRDPRTGRVDTSRVFNRLVNAANLVPAVPGTHWHARFTHLCHYGAGYYSYLYCRVFSSALWHARFRAQPLSGEVGAAYRDRFLSAGGSRPPMDTIRDMLDGAEPRVEALINEICPPDRR